MFGKDAINRFILMCTFADGSNSLMTSALKDYLTFERYFTFNNSGLFTRYTEGITKQKLFWKMTMESIEQFKNFVREQNLEPLNLGLSK